MHRQRPVYAVTQIINQEIFNFATKRPSLIVQLYTNKTQLFKDRIPKEDIKAKLGRSPDLAEGVLYAVVEIRPAIQMKAWRLG